MSALIEGHEMKAQVETITPALAMKWLQEGARNRQLNDAVVRRYGADMLAGRWKLNGQGIVFSVDGRLLDGQHRLTALAATGVTLQMLVVRGASQESFATMDAGRPRTLANVLGIEGRKNTALVSAAARMAWNYVAGLSLKFTPTRAELLNFIHDHAYVEDRSAAIANRSYLVAGLSVPKSAFAAVMTLANEARTLDDKIASYEEGFVTGEGLFHGDPRLTLRRWLERQRQEVGMGGGRIAEPFFAALAKSWSAYVVGKELTQIRLPMFFNAESVEIAGFERRLFPDVPELSRASFAREPKNPDVAAWQSMGRAADDPADRSTAKA